jgi:hypothetical protein
VTRAGHKPARLNQCLGCWLKRGAVKGIAPASSPSILDLLVTGKTIAYGAGVSPKTVDFHRVLAPQNKDTDPAAELVQLVKRVSIAI